MEGAQRMTKKRRKSNKASSGFKKAPQAPRRFKSPYILFSISKIQYYKRIYKTAKVTSFSSLISKEWKALPDDERKKWKIFAEQDKIRYNAEKLLYKGPWHVPSDRPRKDPNAPKRPPSAFLNFSQTRRTELIEANPHVKNTDISKLLGAEWRAAPPEVRQPHIEKEAREREVYHRKISEWRKQQRRNEGIMSISSDRNMSSLTNHEEKVAAEALTTSLPKSPYPPTVMSISVPSSGETINPQKMGISKGIEASIDQTSTNPKVWPSSAGSVNKDMENIDTEHYYPIAATSNSSVSQKIPFPTALRAPPFVLPEAQPTFICSPPRQSALSSTQVNYSRGHPIEGLAISTETALSLRRYSVPAPTSANPMQRRYSAPLPTPVTPVERRYSAPAVGPTPVTPVQAPRRVSTLDYQELFFPPVPDVEEDDSSAKNRNLSPIEPEYFEFLLNSTIEGT